jgi:protocatechuate 3,4-dioxygenase beta subunit
MLALVPVACAADNAASWGGAGSPCALTPEQTAGPFYLAGDLARRQITEGKAGLALVVQLQVVQLPGCKPMADRPVDIWHADHQGWYSGFPGQGAGDIDTTGQTFLRGTQMSDSQGGVSFNTVYPGWYPGRAVHIHFRVHLPDNMQVSSQLYLPDAINDAVHQQPPYVARGAIAVDNGGDGIFASTTGRERLIAEVTQDGGGYRCQLVVGVV